MNATSNETAGERPLEILGIGKAEERAYRWLLAHTAATASDVAHGLTLSAGKTQRLLDTLETKGLVTHSPERPRRYIPALPGIAMKALSLQLQSRLQRADSAIQELQEEATNQPNDKIEPIVELITNRQTELRIFEHMHQTAQREVLTLQRPPLRVSRTNVPPEEDERVQREAQVRGVRFRTITDWEFQDLPGAIERVRNDVNSGEEVRMLPQLPFKLVLADRHLGLIPLNLQQSDSPSLLVRSSTLLEALYTLFTTLWKQATPVSFTSAGVLETVDAAPKTSKLIQEMVLLMAAGRNDKTIASDLGISMRTFRRRSVDMMKNLNARTRFQAGWLANQRLQNRRPSE